MKKIIITIFYLLLTYTLFSQQVNVVTDFGFRSILNIEKELPNGFEINLEQQVRLYSNASEFDEYIADFGGKYKVNKNFKFGADVRYTYNRKRWKEAESDYRYNLDLLYKGQLTTKLNLNYRLRYQHEYVNLFSEYHREKINYAGIRNKLQIQYEVHNRNEIYMSGEIFRLIQTYNEPYFNKLRFYIGDELKTRIGKFRCSLGYEREINVDYPLSFYFTEITYTIKL